jgi:hypothetical protein
MGTMVMALGVIPRDSDDKQITNVATASIGGSDPYMVQTFFVDGKSFQDMRKEAHRHVDACVDQLETKYGKGDKK